MALCDFPDRVPIDLEVIMNDGVSHTGNCTPWHSRAGVLEGLGQAGCLADDLDVPHDVGANELVGVKSARVGGVVESTSSMASSMSPSSNRSVLKAAPPRASDDWPTVRESRFR